jgi:hypothetical protein
LGVATKVPQGQRGKPPRLGLLFGEHRRKFADELFLSRQFLVPRGKYDNGRDPMFFSLRIATAETSPEGLRGGGTNVRVFVVDSGQQTVQCAVGNAACCGASSCMTRNAPAATGGPDFPDIPRPF